jgi:hypothetical protein
MNDVLVTTKDETEKDLKKALDRISEMEADAPETGSVCFAA